MIKQRYFDCKKISQDIKRKAYTAPAGDGKRQTRVKITRTDVTDCGLATDVYEGMPAAVPGNDDVDRVGDLSLAELRDVIRSELLAWAIGKGSTPQLLAEPSKQDA